MWTNLGRAALSGRVNSPGHTDTLFHTSSWEVSLTTNIVDGMMFALVGNESSVPVDRTFVFKDAGGGAIDSLTLCGLDTIDLVRLSTWSAGDDYVRFEYQQPGNVMVVNAVSN